jgi:hypothetical protein
MDMAHIVRIQSDEQYLAVIKVLNHVKGTWHARGPSSAPILFLPDEHYQALVEAGVVSANGIEVNARGKKARARKAKS